jgi:hypothetical protein
LLLGHRFAIAMHLLAPGLTNFSPGAGGQTIANDIELHIRDEVLRIAQRQLVAYQFGQPLRIQKQSGVIYTATRYERLPLPFAPLSEGVAPGGQADHDRAGVKPPPSSGATWFA